MKAKLSLPKTLLTQLSFVIAFVQCAYCQQNNAVGYRQDIVVVRTEVNTFPTIKGEVYRAPLDSNHTLILFDHTLTLDEKNAIESQTEILDAVFPKIENDGYLTIPSEEIIISLNKAASIDDVIELSGIRNYITSIQLIDTLFSNIFLLKQNGRMTETENIATQIRETKLCNFVCVNGWSEIRFNGVNTPTNNPFQPDQWYLKNNGQNGGVAGIDINADCAWQYNQGEGIIVAVLDNGIDTEHPDLQSNIVGSYIATALDSTLYTNEYTPTELSATHGHSPHGTACAGIIAAIDNEIGIVGVAPKAKILNVRIGLTVHHFNVPDFVNFKELAHAIRYAWYNLGASILSCSFTNSGRDSLISYAENELQLAETYGRNGKGCIFVTASGNDDRNNPLFFPASQKGVIVVGATNRCGERKSAGNYTPVSCDQDSTWGSNYGQNDIMAPGEMIATTDLRGSGEYDGYNDGNDPLDYSNRDYTKTFGGTSAAVPIVAGVATLMLSENPELTRQECIEILCRTARKIRPDLYDYADNSYYPSLPRPYGIWDYEVGYGMVDACEAVRAAKHGLEVDFLIKDSPKDTLGTEPNNQTIHWNSPDIKLIDKDTHAEITDIERYTKDTCLVAVNIKNISCTPSRNSMRERLYLTYGKPILTAKNNPLLPSWHTSSYGWINDSIGYSISQLELNEERAAAGYIPFKLPIDYRNKFSSLLGNAFSCFKTQNDASNINNDLLHYKWGFSIMALADEGLGQHNMIANATLPVAPSATLAKNYNSISVTNGNRLIHDDEYGQILAVAPPTNTPFQIRVQQIARNETAYLIDYGKSYLLLSDNLIPLLESRANLKFIDSNRILIEDTVTTLTFCGTAANSDYFIGTEVHFTSDNIPEIEDFEYDIELLEGNVIADAARITAIRNTEVYFTANATASKYKVVRNSETVTLTSNIIEENASYTWYDEQQNIVGQGSQITITPSQSHIFSIEIMRDDNGYYAQDTVGVIVIDGSIVSITPNPSQQKDVSIEYSLNTPSSNAFIRISNISSTTTFTFPTPEAGGVINVENGLLSTGVYVVSLYSNGIVVDSKQLIIY
ncbi:MAG: S8 family serine peptidase [Bacteroidales bacterium]|nr:S8 family serine peptidase [Bacteroidales bacterium]